MKKLLFFAFLLPVVSQNLVAQEKPPINSVSLVAAPNWLIPLPNKQLGDSSLEGRSGYTLGFDFARKMFGRWQFKLGLRYNTWNSVFKSDFLFWPSEFSTGQYVFDPSLPHYFEKNIVDKAWQILAGARWHGKPKKIRTYVDFEIGSTDFAGAKVQSLLTLGAAWGVEWRLTKHFGIFAQPGLRFLYDAGGFGDQFLPFQVEFGGRYSF